MTEQAKLIARLRGGDAVRDAHYLLPTAADEIARLQAENDNLRAQLKTTETALDQELNNGIALNAEVELLQAEKEEMRATVIDWIRMHAENERLQAENTRLRQLVKAVITRRADANKLMIEIMRAQVERLEKDNEKLRGSSNHPSFAPDQVIYHLESIERQLRELSGAPAAHLSIGTEVLADNIDWLDCYVEHLKASTNCETRLSACVRTS